MSAKEDIEPSDPFDLTRFVVAQERSYRDALSEVRAGRKDSHWMWYIFPQIAGLGGSSMARRYAIKSAGEARAYLDHSLLGPRLVECAEAILRVQGRSAREILGFPDDLKLRSCATLFGSVRPGSPVFQRILDRYYQGAPDERTLGILADMSRRQ
ncbi:MAG: DUF1810 domain-containing protein [Polyangiaceae bacterium]